MLALKNVKSLKNMPKISVVRNMIGAVALIKNLQTNKVIFPWIKLLTSAKTSSGLVSEMSIRYGVTP